MKLNGLINLECCDNHFIHKRKKKVWSSKYNKWLKPVGNSKSKNYLLFHSKSTYLPLSSTKIDQIQKEFANKELYKSIPKPEVVHL